MRTMSRASWGKNPAWIMDSDRLSPLRMWSGMPAARRGQVLVGHGLDGEAAGRSGAGCPACEQQAEGPAEEGDARLDPDELAQGHAQLLAFEPEPGRLAGAGAG